LHFPPPRIREEAVPLPVKRCASPIDNKRRIFIAKSLAARTASTFFPALDVGDPGAILGGRWRMSV